MVGTELTLPTTRALLADSHVLYRESLRTFLVFSGVEVASVATHGEQAVEMARAARFNVAAIDQTLGGLGVVETTRRLSAESPNLPILILATSRLDAEIQEAIRCGACGYLFKGDDPEVLLRTLLAAARGTPVLNPELARFLVRALLDRTARDFGVNSLTAEESSLLAEVEASPQREPVASGLARGIFAKLHLLYRG